ncbi:MAG: hypothetical protein ACE5FA_06000 [Dehalococcoidia bacterium]
MSPTAASNRARVATLANVLGDHLTSRPRLDLLLFLGRYPGGWYSRRAIDPLSVFPREAIGEALDGLVDEGVIETVQNGEVTYYRLTTDSRVRAAVIEMARLRRTDRRLLFRRCTGQSTSGADEVYAARWKAQADLSPPERDMG